MRIQAVLPFILLAAPAAVAQDLQITMRIETRIPEMPEAPPASETTMYIKGARLRVDTQLEQASSSMVFDSAAGKTWVLLHEQRVYMESDRSPFSGAMPKTDSATLAAMGMVPQVRKTGERKKIGQHEGERYVSVMQLPAGMAGTSDAATVVSEHWLAVDPALNASYYAYAERMQLLTGDNGQGMAGWAEALQKRVPLQTTMVVVGSQQIVDAEAVLRAENPPGMAMRMIIELKDIRTGVLPDSLFKVPPGYTAAQLR